jgi:hypothetical protein
MTNHLEMYSVRDSEEIARNVLFRTGKSTAIGHTVVAADLPGIGRVAR